MLLTSVLLLCACAAAVGPVNRLFGRVGWVALVPAGLFGWFLVQALGPEPARSEVWRWFPQLGAEGAFRLDGLSALFALLVTGIGAGILLFADKYLDGERGKVRLLTTLCVFMAAMLGLVLADNVILLFVFWELTSITSYLLIGYNHEEALSRKKALQALLVTGGGGLALLAGLLLMAHAAGTTSLSGILAAGEAVRASPLLPLLLVLVFLGAFTKSAQVPFHFWLPNAMAAPTPVSAYLHSATMVKAGVFLLARLHPVFGTEPLWQWTLTLVGAATLATGAGLGWVQTDLKRVLAYTTLAVLGMLTLLLGIGSALALKTFVVVLLGHALYKAALFMVAGIIEHETGTREVTRLGGLRWRLPFTSVAAGLAAASAAGLPPFIGFVGKEFAYKAGTGGEWLAGAALPVLVISNAILFALALKVGWLPFWAPRPADIPAREHEAPVALWLPPLVLGLAGLLAGVFSQVTAQSFAGPAIHAIAGTEGKVELGLWHGIGVPLLLSLATAGFGVFIYRIRRYVWPLRPRVDALPGPMTGYEWGLERLIRFSKQQTRSLMRGSLSRYLELTLAATVALLTWRWVAVPAARALPEIDTVQALPALWCGVALVGAAVAVRSHKRIVALLGLGAVGSAIALLFLHFGAPDLAITQFLVEALVVILLVLAVYRLPALKSEGRAVPRLQLLCCAGFGTAMGLLAFQAGSLGATDRIATTLEDWSLPLAHGRNVVNVILVDFRALDTLGEISVLGIAAIGVVALLRRAAVGKDGP
ncbi:hydrogen gas-evolving membrane-bound hydrogenase subunit E [Nibricoccus sp. IMCC34717]|uniref:hydrogen gas-evolving membrane-bound hydrogenase subunit E n=1 Tax=Nibricoccus sp. IMCC34717 TaxID=3034021 RepID=UPI0038511056